MNVYDQIQDLTPGTEVTITMRGTVKVGVGGRVVALGSGRKLHSYLTDAESVTVHEPAIKWQEGDVVLGAPGETYVRNEDGEWRFSSGYPSFIITDKTAHAYAPVIREGKIVASPAPDGECVTQREVPWEPGQDVTARLASGEHAPDGTILRDCEGALYRVEADGAGTIWLGNRWSINVGSTTWTSWMHYTPLTVATPAQITAAGIHTGGQR